MSAEDTLRLLVKALVPLLREELGIAGDGDRVAHDSLPKALQRPIREACSRGEIKASKVGRRWWIARPEIDAWLERHRPQRAVAAAAEAAANDDATSAMDRAFGAVRVGRSR